MTEEQRIALRNAVGERVMGWTSRRIAWAYAETAELWHDAHDLPVMTHDSWRPDLNDGQVLTVLDQMVARGFNYSLGNTAQTAFAEFHGADALAVRAEHAERRIALLHAAVAAVENANAAEQS